MVKISVVEWKNEWSENGWAMQAILRKRYEQTKYIGFLYERVCYWLIDIAKNWMLKQTEM